MASKLDGSRPYCYKMVIDAIWVQSPWHNNILIVSEYWCVWLLFMEQHLASHTEQPNMMEGVESHPSYWKLCNHMIEQ